MLSNNGDFWFGSSAFDESCCAESGEWRTFLSDGERHLVIFCLLVPALLGVTELLAFGVEFGAEVKVVACCRSKRSRSPTLALLGEQKSSTLNPGEACSFPLLLVADDLDKIFRQEFVVSFPAECLMRLGTAGERRGELVEEHEGDIAF